MNAISLTPGAALRLRDLAKPLARKAAQLLTSVCMSAVLGCMAAVAVLYTQATGSHGTLMAAAVTAWAAQLAAMLATDADKAGKEVAAV